MSTEDLPSRKARQGYVSLSAIDPRDGAQFEVYVSPARMEAVAKRGMHAVLELTEVVTKGLTRPVRIYEGIRHDSDSDTHSEADDWLCYVAKPDKDYRTPGSEMPSPPREGRLFLVFVNSDRVAYTWRWELASQEEPDEPIGVSDLSNPRFVRRVL